MFKKNEVKKSIISIASALLFVAVAFTMVSCDLDDYDAQNHCCPSGTPYSAYDLDNCYATRSACESATSSDDCSVYPVCN